MSLWPAPGIVQSSLGSLAALEDLLTQHVGDSCVAVPLNDKHRCSDIADLPLGFQTAHDKRPDHWQHVGGNCSGGRERRFENHARTRLTRGQVNSHRRSE